MSAVVEGVARPAADGAPWRPAARPAWAAPLAAVDRWRAVPDGDGLRAEGRTAVRGTDPALRGHFPHLTVFPGVFVVEATAQLLGLAAGFRPRLQVLSSVRFLAPLLDGDELALELRATPVEGGWDVVATGRGASGTTAARLRARFGPDYAAPEPDSAGPADAWSGGPGLAPSRVRAVLPQRHPLLLVDRATELDPGRAVRTTKTVSVTEPCYAELPDGASDADHDYPTSLLLESLGQSAALVWFGGEPPDTSDGRVLMFVGARDFRVEGGARPGDVLRHEVRLDYTGSDTAFATGATWVGPRRIASVASLIATRRPAGPAERPPVQ